MMRDEVIEHLKEIADYFRECRMNESFASKAEIHYWELQNAANELIELLKGEDESGLDLDGAADPLDCVDHQNNVGGQRKMEVVTFAARLPVQWMHPIKARKVGMAINQMGGLLAIYPDQRGMVLVFATQAHAEKGRDKLASMRVPVGMYLMRGTLNADMTELSITEPVDGWTEEEKAEIERMKEETKKNWMV